MVEPQALFVAELLDVFSEAGLDVAYVGAQLDPRRILDDEPDLIFFDADNLDKPEVGVYVARSLAPDADIFVYTPILDERASISLISAGATVVVEKTASRRELVQRLREADRRRRATS